MRVKVRFVCPELFGTLPNGLYEVPDGSTIRECTECCAAAGGVTLPEDWADQVIFLKDIKPALADDEAADGADIIVLRRILGG